MAISLSARQPITLVASILQELVISVERKPWTKHTAFSNTRPCQPPITSLVKLPPHYARFEATGVAKQIAGSVLILLLVGLQNIRESGGPQDCQQTGLRPSSESIMSFTIFYWPGESIESLLTLETFELNHSLSYDNI